MSKVGNEAITSVFQFIFNDMQKDYLKPKDTSMRVMRLIDKQVKQWTDMKDPDIIKTFQLYPMSRIEVNIHKISSCKCKI